jgi:hypothetical protein
MKYCVWCGHMKDAHDHGGCFCVLDPETGKVLDGTIFDDNRCICTGFMDKNDIK